MSFLASTAQAVAIFSLRFNFWMQMLPFTISTAYAVNGWTNAALDLFLSFSLIFALRRHVLGFNQSTDNAIRRLIHTAATTASYTAVFSVIAAALTVSATAGTLEGATRFLAFSTPSPALYALSLLATLDARRPLGQTYVSPVSAGSVPALESRKATRPQAEAASSRGSSAGCRRVTERRVGRSDRRTGRRGAGAGQGQVGEGHVRSVWEPPGFGRARAKQVGRAG